MREIEVGWGIEEDEGGISALLEFDGASGLSEERFIVAKEEGRVRAAVRVVAVPGKMSLWGFVADPRVKAEELAGAIYGGACRLARELGIREVWADDEWHRESLLEAGYRRRIGGWRLDVGEEPCGSAPRRSISLRPAAFWRFGI